MGCVGVIDEWFKIELIKCITCTWYWDDGNDGYNKTRVIKHQIYCNVIVSEQHLATCFFVLLQVFIGQ